MTKQSEALKLALEALDGLYLPGELERVNAAITAMREALAEQPAQQQEPVAWNEPTPDFYITTLSRNTIKYTNAVWGKQDFSKEKRDECVVPVWFASPPQRQPLTDEEVKKIWGSYFSRGIEFARAIEAAHGIKEQK